MAKRSMTYDCYDYNKYREQIDHLLSRGFILTEHTTWFTKGAEIDNGVQAHLEKNKCIVLLIANPGGKLVGVVACGDRKNFAGINVGDVEEVIYDRDDRDFKKKLNKFKGFFKGKGLKGIDTYMSNFVEYRNWY